MRLRPFIMQYFFRFDNGPVLPVLFVTSFLNPLYECRILCAALGTNKHDFFSYDTDGDHTYHAYQVLYSSSSYCCRCILLQVPRSCCCTKRVMPLESSHGHHLPARAASARAARGRCRSDPWKLVQNMQVQENDLCDL